VPRYRYFSIANPEKFKLISIEAPIEGFEF
jgi:hypothetical protein